MKYEVTENKRNDGYSIKDEMTLFLHLILLISTRGRLQGEVGLAVATLGYKGNKFQTNTCMSDILNVTL